jgi:hypothetical protein
VNGDGRPREPGQAEIWSAGSKRQFTALKTAPGVRLLHGVGPAKNTRRQRAAAPPHHAARARPREAETRTRPTAPATERQQPSHPRPAAPGTFTPSRRPQGHQRLLGSSECCAVLHQMAQRELVQHVSKGVVFVVAAALTPVTT